MSYGPDYVYGLKLEIVHFTVFSDINMWFKGVFWRVRKGVSTKILVIVVIYMWGYKD